MVHVRETAEGERPRFGHSGWLWRDVFLLYDRETESLWHPVWGRALSGPLRGRSLRRLPTALATYGAWRSEHPGTLVLRKPDPAPGVPAADVDTYAARTAQLGLGFGIDVGAASRLYPFAAFPRSGVVEDEVEGVPVVVAQDPVPSGAYAYDRRVGGDTVSFEADAAGAGGRPVLRERGGRRAWYLRTGTPVPGSGAEAALARIPGAVWAEVPWGFQHPHGTVGVPAPSSRER